ncbi:MAG: WYL domain-containing protein, partial [Dysgonamonadaceae bacterium]|nr:WYL domain-containing protein [Dysgonamonadaceae bacterium]
MDSYPLIKRFSIIVETISQRPPTLKGLLDHLHEKGFEISKRTLQRDIDNLKIDFGLDIQYKASTHTYHLDKDKSEHLDALLRLIQLFHTSDILWQSIKEKESFLSLISFENTKNEYVGINYLEPMLNAIRTCKLVSFEYENFAKNTLSSYSVKPLLLKEYNRKWYIIGAFADTDLLRTFALDRISNLRIEIQHFAEELREKTAGLFDNCIGLDYSPKPEVIKIAVTPVLAKYFKRIPLHASQHIESETATEVVFSYFLSPNRELQQLLLKYG